MFDTQLGTQPTPFMRYHETKRQTQPTTTKHHSIQSNSFAKLFIQVHALTPLASSLFNLPTHLPIPI